MFRAKIVPYSGVNEYGEWYASEIEVRAAMEKLKRALGSRYYCEMQMIACETCSVSEDAKVIAIL
jgi:hypothetical protein